MKKCSGLFILLLAKKRVPSPKQSDNVTPPWLSECQPEGETNERGFPLPLCVLIGDEPHAGPASTGMQLLVNTVDVQAVANRNTIQITIPVNVVSVLEQPGMAEGVWMGNTNDMGFCFVPETGGGQMFR